MSHAVFGHSLIAGQPFVESTGTFRPTSPLNSQPLEPEFLECSLSAVDRALTAAEAAFARYRRFPVEGRATFLERIADEIMALGDTLLQRAHEESALPLDRLTGERGRTVGQLRLFAEVLREGSWVDARIDTALPDRKPVPKPDLRRMLLPLGPIIVFGASNFPLAFSVAGGDTASALAAGCPVVIKGHPAHPGTSALVASAIAKAVDACGLPSGVFSLLQNSGVEIGLALVRHPLTKGVGFTGSRTAGRALFDAAAARPEPIPVFAEMSSVNPIFILPGALKERGAQIVEGLKISVTAGAGQFCTKPGLVFGVGSTELEGFSRNLGTAIEGVAPTSMLHGGIAKNYRQGLERLSQAAGVSAVGTSTVAADPVKTQAEARVFSTEGAVFLGSRDLSEEVFGPATLLTRASGLPELLAIARGLEGQLTATIHGTAEDLAGAGELIAILERKAGRLIINGYPTGVEVCPSMQHGGPYPATTDARFTSVGTAAIQRWARPVCYQGFPGEALPAELQDANPRGIMRLVNSQLTRDPLAQG